MYKLTSVIFLIAGLLLAGVTGTSAQSVEERAVEERAIDKSPNEKLPPDASLRCDLIVQATVSDQPTTIVDEGLHRQILSLEIESVRFSTGQPPDSDLQAYQVGGIRAAGQQHDQDTENRFWCLKDLRAYDLPWAVLHRGNEAQMADWPRMPEGDWVPGPAADP